MRQDVEHLRALLGSHDEAQRAQGRELLAALGDRAAYRRLLRGWAWTRESWGLWWQGAGEMPMPAWAAEEVWRSAPPDVRFPRELAPAAIRRLRESWAGDPARLAQLRDLPRLDSLYVTMTAGSPPLPLAELPGTLRCLLLSRLGPPQPGELAGLRGLAGVRSLALGPVGLGAATLPPRLEALGIGVNPQSTAQDLGALLDGARLKRLAIQGSGPALPPDALAGLRALKISGRYRDALPDLSPLEHLRELSLETGDLDALLAAIAALPRLWLLALRGSQLQSLPPALGDLSRLRRLDLSQNPLIEDALPRQVAQLSALRELDLSFTQIELLPQWMTELRGLEALDVYKTPLRYLPVQLLLSLPNLRRLRVPERLQEQAEDLARRAWEHSGQRIELREDSPLSRGPRMW